MSLYLALFEGDEEILGWVFGHYSDFGCFCDTIAKKLPSNRYPSLLEHSDSDGEWSPMQLVQLRQELTDIASHFKRMAPEEPIGAFEHTQEFRANARSLYDCFHNVDGENLFEALRALCDEGIRRNLSVAFQ